MSSMTMTGLKRYPVYKASSIPWLGEIPDHWLVQRGKQLLKKMERDVSEDEDVITCFRDGQVTLRRNRRTEGFTESLKEIGYQGIRKGDLVIHEMDAFAGSVGVSDSDGKGTPVYSVCKPAPNANAYYYAAVVREMARSQWILALAKGIRERSTDFRYATLAAEPLPMPPFSEQQAIVRYLDGADQRIRAYVSAKEKFIALLEEERQAVIHQAVTKGLDPNVRLKPSGVEWLGDVPEHWKAVQLGRIGSFSKGSGGTKDDEVPKGIPCIRYGDLYTTHKFFIDQTRSFIRDEKLEQYTPIKRGDVLFPASGETIEEIGKSAVNLLDAPVYCGSDLIIFRPSVPMDPKFSGYVLDTPISQDQKSRMGRGVSIMHVYSNQLKYLWLGLPPVDEQEAIAEHIDRVTSAIDTAIDRARRQIELMEEYRIRLIADVVTGKLDVRETKP